MAIMETARLKQVARLVLLGFVPSAVSFSASAASLDAAREISQTATWSVLNDRLPIVVPRLLPPKAGLPTRTPARPISAQFQATIA